MPNRPWTRNELIVALNLYLKLPFGKLHSRTIEIVRLAELIGRTPSAMAMRLSNFASVDPYHQNRGIVGLVGGRRQVEPIWDEFAGDKEALIFESEIILAELEKLPLEKKYAHLLKGISAIQGEDKIRETKTRVNQQVFREIVLSNYSERCAISGISIPSLLVSSHIIPWALNETERLNPENGICLSALYDRAFDKGLITVNQEFNVIISDKLKSNDSKIWYQKHFHFYDGKPIILPKKYYPKREFLAYHFNNIFVR
jgi:putative restriction endonuclease